MTKTLTYGLDPAGKPGWTVDQKLFFVTKKAFFAAVNTEGTPVKGEVTSFTTKKGKVVKRPSFTVTLTETVTESAEA